MGSTFNPQILVDKLAKLNSSQQSIETLSHWCIFHMNKARQVVETWDRQFHCCPREQRLAFLYLANDILQNSRRKGSEFVGEFWKVLPDALHDVIDYGDEFGKNAARRLIGIWEERKVFGSRGQILKEELVGRHIENSNRNGKPSGFKLRQCGNTVDKIVSGYQIVYGGQLDEDVLLSKCRNAISFVEKVDKEMAGGISSGQLHASGFVEEVQLQNGVLRDCIEQLTAVESSRASLVSYLREAIQEQEYKLDQVRNQLQAAQAHSEQASNMCQQLLSSNNVHLQPEQALKEAQTSKAPPNISGNGEQLAPVMYTRQVPYPETTSQNEDEHRKSAAAEVAAKLTASTSSAQMLTYVLSSLASEGVIGNSMKESSADYQSEKRPKLDNDQSSYVQPQNPQPPVPPYSDTESVQPDVTTSQQITPNEQPTPPSSSPAPLPPLPPIAPYAMPPFMQAAGSIPNVPFSFGTTPLQPPAMPGYTAVGPPGIVMPPFNAPTNPYQNFPGSDGGFYSQHPQSSLPMAPISRQ